MGKSKKSRKKPEKNKASSKRKIETELDIYSDNDLPIYDGSLIAVRPNSCTVSTEELACSDRVLDQDIITSSSIHFRDMRKFLVYDVYHDNDMPVFL